MNISINMDIQEKQTLISFSIDGVKLTNKEVKDFMNDNYKELERISSPDIIIGDQIEAINTTQKFLIINAYLELANSLDKLINGGE